MELRNRKMFFDLIGPEYGKWHDREVSGGKGRMMKSNFLFLEAKGLPLLDSRCYSMGSRR